MFIFVLPQNVIPVANRLKLFRRISVSNNFIILISSQLNRGMYFLIILFYLRYKINFNLVSTIKFNSGEN